MRIGVGLSIPELATRGGRFSPASLFTGGVQGAWYDPSDYSTLFQDSAGTTPVTAVEQPVGLMLDKSQGLVLGSELITPEANRDFSSDTGYWTKGTDWTISGGVASRPASTTSSNLTRSNLLTLGVWYEITFTATVSAGTLIVYAGSSSFKDFSVGTYTNQKIRLNCSGSTSLIFQASGASSSVTVDNISVKELPGNHASQATAASRPVLRARYNLLTYSEQFDNAAWFAGSTTVSANQATAPDGTVTADLVYVATTGASRYIWRNASVFTASAQVITSSFYLKASSWTWVMVNGTGTNTGVWFNIATGQKGTESAGYTGTITDAGNGWWRCTVTETRTGTVQPTVFLCDANNSLTATASGTNGVYLWGAQLSYGSSAGTYQRIAAATVYDTTGFLPYLAADGSDDQMSIPSAAISAATAITEMHAAWRPAGFGAGNGVVFGSTGTDGVNDHEPFSDGALYYGFASSARQTFGSLGTVTTPYILDATQTGTTLAVNKNGTQLSTTKTVSIGIGSSPRLFAANNATIQFWAGNFFGGLLIKKVLSASEMTALRSWLAAKSGVVL